MVTYIFFKKWIKYNLQNDNITWYDIHKSLKNNEFINLHYQNTLNLCKEKINKNIFLQSS